MTPHRIAPPLDKLVARRKGVLYVPAAEGLPTPLNGLRSTGPIHGLPLPSEERGRRVAALLAAAREL
jgi:hypothetical protein